MGLSFRPKRKLAAGRIVRAVVALALSSTAIGLIPAHAQSSATKPMSAKQQPAQTDRLFLQAQEMIYNRDANTIEARGQVQLYYQGRVLQADRVLYDRDKERVFAEGSAKLTEQDGTISYGNRIELTDDFKQGFVDSLRIDTTDQSFLTAARAERVDGNVNVLERGTYTACKACEDDPSKPPLWQVRAKRIVHNKDEHTVYYEDASLELMGLPVAWMPFFSAPDADARRKSGILAPRYVVRNNLGVGVGAPIFWAIAPNYDLTVTPTLYSQQGLFLDTEWRHQLVNGAYRVRMSGIFQNDPGAFLKPPSGPGNERFRGSFETSGQFLLNERWRFGWDITVLGDRWFFQDYRILASSLSSNYFREAISSVYLNGQSDRAYFDARAYYFKGLSRYDLQEQQPIVAPIVDYNKTIDIDPRKNGIGGQVEIDGNFTHLTRSLASYEAVGPRQLDSVYKLYSICPTSGPTRDNCIVRGMGGDYTRMTMNLSWKQQMIDGAGQVWTPFAFTRVNGAFATLNRTNEVIFGAGGVGASITNAHQATLFGQDANSWLGQITPGVGVEYRFPFIATSSIGNHVIEPIVQVIARPSEISNASFVNEDSQSLVFDDTNLFMWNKFSGYDRFEGGTRLNYGAQYTLTLRNGGYANMMVGQSYQLAGTNTYATADAAHVGIASGLDTRQSDLVTRFALAPNAFTSFMVKGRFDPNDMTMRRLDVAASARFSNKLEGSLQYARYEAQPYIGYDKRREGVSTAVKYKFHENYYASGNVIFDLSRHLYNTNQAVGGNAGLFSLAGVGGGIGYMDDCTTVAVNYASVYQDKGTGTPVRNQTILVQLQLRTLGDTRVQSSLSAVRVDDGLGGLQGP